MNEHIVRYKYYFPFRALPLHFSIFDDQFWFPEIVNYLLGVLECQKVEKGRPLFSFIVVDGSWLH